MDLVEHHERRSPEVVREQVRSGGDLLIGHDHAVDVWVPCSVGVAPARIQMQANEVGGVGPLRSERHRRADDNHLLNPCRPSSVTGGERLTRARRRDEQKVGAGRGCLKRDELHLPRSQRAARGTPTRAHGTRPPLRRLHRGHRALPFAAAVSPPARTGFT
jgi:hypothetical protein